MGKVGIEDRKFITNALILLLFGVYAGTCSCWCAAAFAFCTQIDRFSHPSKNL